MCGRFYLDVSFEELLTRYDLRRLEELYEPRKEIFPTQPVLMLPQGEKRHFEPVLWGIQQPYLKRPLINARSETVFEKTMFKQLIWTHRCLIPMKGYYEWQQVEKQKIKHRIFAADGQIMSFAGLYGEYYYEGEKKTMCVILTKEAEPELVSIHPRMPVVLSIENELKYLEAQNQIDVERLFLRQPVDFSIEVC